MGYYAKHQDGQKYWHAGENDGLRQRCGGTGTLECNCGGDQCYCGNFGEAECFGCPDCEGERDEDWDYPDDDKYDDLANTDPAAPAPPPTAPLSAATANPSAARDTPHLTMLPGLTTTYDEPAPYRHD